MKKRFLLIALAFVCVFALVACGNNSGDAGAEDYADESGETAGATLDYDASYLSWSGEDWAAASEEEQNECTRAYLYASAEATAEAMGQGVEGNTELDDDTIASARDELSTIFDQDPSLTIQDQIDALVATVAVAAQAAEEE